ncbi:MAG: NusG domain II-containing protein [Magnetococcales bacterium]|nr:NusG domain II-containing protein [Magnetococcales bacterium]
MFFSLLRNATTPLDRLVLLVSISIIGMWIVRPWSEPASKLEVFLNNQPVASLSLLSDSEITLDGRLGAVRIEIRDQEARLQEFKSPRLIGTRTGWISRPGQVAACVPCGIFIRVRSGIYQEPKYDAVAY